MMILAQELTMLMEHLIIFVNVKTGWRKAVLTPENLDPILLNLNKWLITIMESLLKNINV